MKITLFLLGILATSLSYAQGLTPIPQNHKLKKILKKFATKPYDMAYVLPQTTVGVNAPEAKYLQTLPNGNRVYALPQDNMPCIVPNESLTAMPNVAGITFTPYRYKGPDAIPNPAVPIQIIPKKEIQKK